LIAVAFAVVVSTLAITTRTPSPDERPSTKSAPAERPSTKETPGERPFSPDERRPQEARPLSPPLPPKFVGGYIETWYDQPIQEVPAEYDVLFSAFARIDGDGRATYTHGDGQTREDFIDGIAARRNEGKPVILSIGGAEGSEVPLDPGPEVETFLRSIRQIIDTYGFAGIDWDLEDDLPDGREISVAGLVDISNRLHAVYGDSFIISMAPYGEDSEGTDATYLEVATQIRDILDFVGYQHYNGRSAPTPASVRATMERWMATAGLRPDQWSVGFLARDDQQGLTTSYATMTEIYREINERHPTVRGVWTWAVYEKDKPAGYPFVANLAPVVRQSG